MKLLLPWRAPLACGLTVALLSVAFLAPAHAGDAAASDIAIPLGAWVSSALANGGPAVSAWLVYLIGRWAPPYIKLLATEALVTKAVNYGLAAVEGAIAGKTLDVRTTNVVIDAALHYAVRVEPAVAKWVGSNLAPMLLAKMGELGVVPPEASSATTRVTINPRP